MIEHQKQQHNKQPITIEYQLEILFSDVTK